MEEPFPPAKVGHKSNSLKYNKNFDKSSAVFGFDDGDESWETKDNSNEWALFKRADYTGSDWESAFEARYPDDYNDPSNLSQVAQWIYSTDPEQATDAALQSSVTYEGTTYTTDSAAYRVAKFRNELTNWFDQQDTLFYYLFTELFLMVDSRVKNSFPTLYASHTGAKWRWLPYDMDTAIGINNEGALAFDYSLEDTDMLSATAGVYNGYQTVMWNNVRRAFPSELQALYQTVRANGIIDYDVVEQRFEAHQNQWNEAIFNEDADHKYVTPFVEDGENNLYMCLGSKAEQRKWWLYNRFRYIDSKYTAGLATSSTLQMRVYQKSDLVVTPYADIYASCLYDSNLVKQRAPRGQATTLTSPSAWNPGGADAVLRIYSADQIKSLGDLSGFYVGAVSFAAATKLQEVKLGDSDANYSNENLTEVTFGTNKLLKSVDIRNCPNLTGIIDVSHCENLETVHLEGTSVTGVSLADGGAAKYVYLPDTVTNLTLKNLPYLTTLDLNDYSNITTLWVENIDSTLVDGMDIVYNDMAEGGRVRITGIDKTYSSDADFTATMRKMMTMRGIDSSGNNLEEAYLEGEVTVGEIARYIYDNLYRWPYLTVHYTSIGAYDYVLHLQNSTDFTEYNDDVITNIRPYAFYSSNIQKCNTPNVTTIGAEAFEKSKLTSAEFPNVTTIGGKAFQGVPTITKVDMPLLTSVPADAFNGVGTLTSLNLPNITSIGSGGLYATATEHMYFPKVKSLGAQALRWATSNNTVKTFVLPELTSMDSNNVFAQNTGVEGVDFGPLAKIYGIPNSPSLTILVLRKTNSITELNNTSVFNSTPFASGGSGGTIYVPQALISTYQSATNWATVHGYGTITWMPIEGSIYETQYVDGTPIPTE